MPAGDFSARSVRSFDEVKPKLGASLLDPDLLRATVLSRVVISRAQREREITPFVANANTVFRYFSAGTRLNVPSPCTLRFSTRICVALPSGPMVNVTPLLPTAFSPSVSYVNVSRS
jgi:hypothetical protein